VVGELSDHAAGPPLVKVGYLREPLRQHFPAEQTTALLLVHYLRTENPEGLREFSKRLAAGESELSSFSVAFPGLTNAALDAAVADLRSRPRSHRIRVAVTAYAGEMRVESMDAAQVHALWDLLRRGVAASR
jgi:hypothetical protein